MPKGRNITNNQRSIVFKQANGKCQYCLSKVSGGWVEYSPMTKWGKEGKSGFTLIDCVIHHIKPLSQGGMDNSENWALTCNSCHSFIHSFLSRYNEIIYPVNNFNVLINNNGDISLSPSIRELLEKYHV